MNVDFLVFCLTTLYTPGPNVLAGMYNAGRTGFRRSFRFNSGIFTAQFFVLLLTLLLTGLFEKAIGRAETVMRVIGACYLLYLAWKYLRADYSAVAEKETGGAWIDGFLLAVLNPKFWLFALMVMENYILTAATFPGRLALTLLVFGLGALAVILWSAFGTALRKLFRKHGKVISVIFSLLLVYCAVKLLFF